MQTVGWEKSLENTIVRIYEKICKWQWVFFFQCLLLVETEFHPQKQLAKSFEPSESLTWLTYCSSNPSWVPPKISLLQMAKWWWFWAPAFEKQMVQEIFKESEKRKDDGDGQTAVDKTWYLIRCSLCLTPAPPSSFQLNATTNLCTLSLFFQKLRRG
jgi:hypothetical protein